MATPTDYDKMNADLKQWAVYHAQKMSRLVGSLTLRDKIAVYKSVRAAIKNKEYKPLVPSIGAAVKQEFGQVSRINFRFAKQGIYLEHGVGDARGIRSGKTRPKPWLVPIMDPAIDILADLVSKNYADIAAGEIKFFIPGIIDRRININNG